MNETFQRYTSTPQTIREKLQLLSSLDDPFLHQTVQRTISFDSCNAVIYPLDQLDALVTERDRVAQVIPVTGMVTFFTSAMNFL